MLNNQHKEEMLMFTQKPGSDTPKSVLDSIMRVKRGSLAAPTETPVKDRSTK